MKEIKNETEKKVIDGEFKEINPEAEQDQTAGEQTPAEETPKAAEEPKKEGFFKKAWRTTKKAAPYLAAGATIIIVTVKVVKAIHKGDVAEAVDAVKETVVPAITDNSQALIQTTVDTAKEAVPEVVENVTEEVMK